MRKDFGSVTASADGSYNVNYIITVENIGGADGTYGLTDSPLFDDDITITAWDYTFVDVGAGIGNGPAFIGTPPSPIDFGTKLLTEGNTHIYTIGFKVIIDLDEESNDGGDNEYTACSDPGDGPGSNPGEGLYNKAELDRDADGTVDITDDACGDLPYVVMEKDVVNVTTNGDGTYTVSYSIVVQNEGGITGTYNLTDTPMFDDDITILFGGFTINQACCPELAGDFIGNPGSINLASNASIDPGSTDIYTIDFVVELDLEEGSIDGGDNVYTACDGSGDGSEGNPGEGLYNLAELDRNADGTVEVEDDACEDLPYLIMKKDFISATPKPDGTFDVAYTIIVSNIGGTTGSYALTDNPSFDDDITINEGSFEGLLNCCADIFDTFLGDPGLITLTPNTSLDAGLTDTFNLIFNVTLDLQRVSPGDNTYSYCSELGDNPGDDPMVALFNLATLDIDADGTEDIKDDACGDLPYIELEKDFISAIPKADGTFDITYTIEVTNIGGATGTYTLTDTPSFDDDITINEGSYSGVLGCCGAIGDTFIGDPGSIILYENASLDAGSTDTYTVSFNVMLDLEEGSTDGGDNEYLPCAEPGENSSGNPGEGLYNLAELDRNADGTVEVEDDACGDLPFIEMEKDFISALQLEDGTYDVTYRIEVSNIGGAPGTYTLTDTPSFDDDITINEVSYDGVLSCCGPISDAFIGNPGTLLLVDGASIDQTKTDIINLTFNISLDLSEDSEDGGDNIYSPCDESETGPGNPGEGLYNLAELDRNDDGTFEVEDDACGDLPASLGDYVWEDKNGNGAQDEGIDAALEGVEVVLSGTTDEGQAVTATTTTDVNGFYQFINLAPGDYKVTFPTTVDIDGNPALLTREDATGDADDANDTNDDSDPDVDTGMTETVNLDYAEHDPRLDAGYYVPGTISGFVLEDIDNDDEGEEPIEGIIIELIDNFNGEVVGTATTDENGFYEFTDLAPGDYKLNEATEPGANWQDVTDFDMSVNANDPDGDDGFAPNDMIPVILMSGEDDEDNNFVEERLVAIGDFVWLDENANGIQDNDEEGIEGVVVNLLDADGNIIDTETTDDAGLYWFDNLEPGIYEIQFVAPIGFETSPQNVNGGSADDNGNDSDADPNTGLSGEVELTNGEEERDVDAGFYELASLGDQVWLDSDGDGINDPEEDGIEGITVNLLDENGNPTGKSDVTDQDGFYGFDGLLPGTYQVEFIVPAGSELTIQDVLAPGADDTNDSDADPDTGLSQKVTLASGENNPTVDAGIYELLSLGDLVWIDINNDGIKDDNEDGIGFVDLALWLDLNGDNSPDINTGRTALTGFDGSYLFENLPPGDYIVQVVPSNFSPGGELMDYTSSTGNGEPTDPDDDVNNDDDGFDPGIGIGVISKTISLRSVQEPINDGDTDPNSNLTVDFGFFDDGQLGDYVWSDENANGVQDNTEQGINNVTVNLYDANNPGAPIATTITAENPNDATKQGYYIFENLVPGDYFVEFVTPEGYIITRPGEAADQVDSDVDESNGPGTTGTITLGFGEENLNVDAGYYLSIKVGNYAWVDNMQNPETADIQDDLDTGLNGVTVNLYSTSDLFTPFRTMETADDEEGNPGYYLFTDLPVGMYLVEFVKPEGLSFVVPNVGDDEVDSDVVDLFMGRTLTFEVFPGDCILDIDAGFRMPPLPVDWLYIRGEWNEERDVNEITWATASEVNSDYYIVERSYENEGFEDVGRVESVGNTSSESTYNFDDEDIERNGKYYYRLRQVDLDGTYDYSDIVVITIDRKGDFKADVYPNPAYRFVNINIETSEAIDVRAVILDATGKLVMDNVIDGEVTAGTSEIRVPIETLSAGTYIIRLVAGENIINKKVLVLSR
ncbi:MAG: SdrD B-like domain-containing protein [Saprospiraceae bacterium]|nr:SdrD B-like domain-containing protein [Saprospiraceae bacterium]